MDSQQENGSFFSYQNLLRLEDRVSEIFLRYPWIGWGVWIVFCINSLVRTDPKRFGSTFQAYLDAAHAFWSGQTIYDMSTLGEYLYWPVSLLVLGPLPMLQPVVAAAIAMAISAALLSVAAYFFMKLLLPEQSGRDVLNLAGVLLMINIPVAWFNLKYVQAQVGMTAFMMLAAVAIARRRWALGALWLFLSIITKPLSLVMLLLCGATQPKMRLWLALALVAALTLPFAFAHPAYVAEQYRIWIVKLQQLTSVEPGQWLYQADFATMLDSFGLALPHTVQTAIRLAAALGFLALVWRIARYGNIVVFAVAVMLYAACYINLFGPRNEFLSYMVFTPALTGVALMLLRRNARDHRAWLLIIAVLLIDFHGALAVDRVLKPVLAFIVLGWMIYMTIDMRRWVELLGATAAQSK
ncbi:glycosyltransferase 87 family protein [Pseudolabrys sp. Root1462]|uniref:glycosyltransferase 87 family protein n=1 Tax=Pseudolabrys sp. Root1462 TaxID=1736466 RepID=UPI00138F29D4|nr:glycosyltransferase 87 family protein [Pseudolabrys sp. Root1462]